jgi:hypothetical protein
VLDGSVKRIICQLERHVWLGENSVHLLNRIIISLVRGRLDLGYLQDFTMTASPTPGDR